MKKTTQSDVHVRTKSRPRITTGETDEVVLRAQIGVASGDHAPNFSDAEAYRASATLHPGEPHRVSFVSGSRDAQARFEAIGLNAFSVKEFFETWQVMTFLRDRRREREGAEGKIEKPKRKKHEGARAALH